VITACPVTHIYHDAGVMSKRRKQVIYLIGCVGAVLGWLILRDQQPTYEKHDLSYWLAQYREPHSPKEADEAARAVKAIGSNAIPFLVDWLQYEPGAFRRNFHRAGSRLPPRLFLNSFAQKHLVAGAADRRSEAAVGGFEILGSTATPAITELVQIVKSPKLFAGSRSLYALGNIGTNALPELLTLISDPAQKQRAFAIGIIPFMHERGVNVKTSVPVLQRCLEDTNPVVRREATNVLLQIDPSVFANAATNVAPIQSLPVERN
jgi:hypothetical protein